MRKILFSILILAAYCPPACASPKDDLPGYWKLRRGEGGPCAGEIRELSYYFGRDGRYQATAVMNPGSQYKAIGTYTATDTSAEALVNGQKIGPYPYRIENGLLFIDHPQFGCRVVLEREDY